MHLFEVIKKPLITEKNTLLQEKGRYVFEVDKRATKPEIKEAVELAFKVNVTEVNVVKTPGRKKRMGRREIKTPDRKKAIVELQPGQKIQLFEGV